MRGHVTLCYMGVGGNLNSPLHLFISFAKALMELGFRSDLFLAKDSLPLPPRGPNLNAHAERWVRAIKEECLSKLIYGMSCPISWIIIIKRETTKAKTI